MFAAFATAFFFALAGVFAKRSGAVLGTVRANAARLAVAAVILSLWAHTRGLGWGGQPGYFVLAGGLGFGLGGLAMFSALGRLSSPPALLLVQSCAAAWATALAWWWLGEPLSTKQLLAALVILAGAGWGVGLGNISNLAKTWELRGIGFGMAAALAQGASLVISRKGLLELRALGLRPADFDILLTAAYQRLAGGLAVAGVAFLLWRWLKPAMAKANASSPPVSPSTHQRAWLWVLLNALCGPVLGVSCWLWAASRWHPGLVQTVAACAPLFAVPLAARMEGRRPAWRFYAGLLVVAGGTLALAF